MKLRKLNGQGVSEFTQFVNNLRNGIAQNTPTHLLDEHESSEAVEIDINIADTQFASRFKMGLHLVTIFEGHGVQPYIGDVGFWSWLGLLWFDQLCPGKDGKRSPSKDYNYILSTKFNHRPRHAVYMTWQLVDRYGGDCAFLLSKEMSTRGEITEQMMARQEILSADGVMRLASSLYFDPATGIFKRGAASRTGAGCVSRYISWLDQLKLTYDLFHMSKQKLENLLPPEFDKFRPAA
jgi:hypothetical protein